MSATTICLYGLDVIFELSTTLVLPCGAHNLSDPGVGHLLAPLSVSPPHCKARWGDTIIEGGHKLFHVAEEATVQPYTGSLITPIGALELLVGLKAPPPGFRVLSDSFTQQGLQYSLKNRRPFLRLIFTCEAYEVEWSVGHWRRCAVNGRWRWSLKGGLPKKIGALKTSLPQHGHTYIHTYMRTWISTCIHP